VAHFLGPDSRQLVGALRVVGVVGLIGRIGVGRVILA
jgi:hypothetical protein